MGEDATLEEKEMGALQPSFPSGRVKRIIKLDSDIGKLTTEALLLVSESAEMFLGFLAEKSAEVAVEKKRKMVKLEHLRMAVKRHRPTSDFLLDELPLPSQPLVAEHPAKDRARTRVAGVSDKRSLGNTRRIDSFFLQSENGNKNGPIESENGDKNGPIITENEESDPL